MSFTFIPNHGKLINPCIDNSILEKIINNWDYYETEKNHIMINQIWNIVYPHIPQTYNNQKLVGFDLDKTILNKTISNKHSYKISKKMKEKEKYDKNGNISLVTLLICCNQSKGLIRFYDDKINGVKFENEEHEFYQSKLDLGNIFMFTNEVSYEENICQSNKYILKIPIFYTWNKKFNKKNNIKYKKTFEIPTPNGQKYTITQCIVNLKNVTLTPDLKIKVNKIRWKEVNSRNKILIIDKYKIPSFIDTKKGRPPSFQEDYCPNCFEILSLNPIDYTNCSNCLSPIVQINEKAIKNK